MVNVGIIGLSSNWNTRYWPVLEKLRGRIRVSAVYDFVSSRAHQIAEHVQARVVEGIVPLAERPDVDALLFLDSAWHGDALIAAVFARRKPIFLSHSFAINSELLRQLQASAVENGITLMPELDLRYTPVTGRLQELFATRLGRPNKIVLEINRPAHGPSASLNDAPMPAQVLTGWLDWLQYLIRTSPTSVSTEPINSNSSEAADAGHLVRIQFAAPNQDRLHTVAEQRIAGGATAELAILNHRSERQVTDGVRIEITCESGSATGDGPFSLSWKADSEPVTESLTGERSAVEVMLDHFCRRVVGGLIPIPDLKDVSQSMRIARAVERSLQSGQPVLVESKVRAAS